MKNRNPLKVVALAAVAAVALFTGCKKQEAPAPESGQVSTPAAAAPVLRDAKPEEIGKEVVCPVMNVKFKVKKSTKIYGYKGESYYMCCGHCVQEFPKTPDKYAK